MKQPTTETKTPANRIIDPQVLDFCRRSPQVENCNPQRAFPSNYSSIASTSATNRWLLSSRNALITLNAESLKPPMFMMSARSQA
jgi:hypothetical protein